MAVGPTLPLLTDTRRLLRNLVVFTFLVTVTEILAVVFNVRHVDQRQIRVLLG
jgi:hypothetical protein